MEAVAKRRFRRSHNHFVDKNNGKISSSNSAVAFMACKQQNDQGCECGMLHQQQEQQQQHVHDKTEHVYTYRQKINYYVFNYKLAAHHHLFRRTMPC